MCNNNNYSDNKIFICLPILIQSLLIIFLTVKSFYFSKWIKSETHDSSSVDSIYISFVDQVFEISNHRAYQTQLKVWINTRFNISHIHGMVTAWATTWTWASSSVSTVTSPSSWASVLDAWRSSGISTCIPMSVFVAGWWRLPSWSDPPTIGSFLSDGRFLKCIFLQTLVASVSISLHSSVSWLGPLTEMWSRLAIMSFLSRLLNLVFTLFTALAPRSTTSLDMGWVRQVWTASTICGKLILWATCS